VKDRIPTEIVEIAGKPGEYAIRYGEYDAEGNLIGYRYFAPADEPIEKGTAINKASLLKDDTAALYGLGADAVPDDVFAAIKHTLDFKAQAVIGSYTGDGTDTRTIDIGFTPSFVFIWLDNANATPTLCYKISSSSVLVTLAYRGHNTTHTTTNGGFLVGALDKPTSGNSTNESNSTYRYLAVGV